MKAPKHLPALAAMACVMAAGAAMAQSAGFDLWSHLINTNSTTQWDLQPANLRPRVVKAEGVPGEGALRISAKAGPNPWSTQATTPVPTAIAVGDVVMVSFYARAERAPEGGARLPTRLQLTAAPYTAVIETQTTLTSEWAQHCAHTVATTSLPAGSAALSVHMGQATQVIELGPVFIFNLGQGFDRAKLPVCG